MRRAARAVRADAGVQSSAYDFCPCSAVARPRRRARTCEGWNGMLERELQIEAHGNRLSGTFCQPTALGRFPTVLMVHGSGPQDRDENMPGQRLDVFNTIAHHLARAGFASLRYDKRGCGKSSGDYLRAGQADLVADVLAWIDRLRVESSCSDKLFLLGHSE